MSSAHAQVARDRGPDLLTGAVHGHRRVLGQRAHAVSVDQGEQAVHHALGLGDRVPGVVVSHATVDFRRPLGRGDDVVVACELDAIGRASFRTRETVIAGGGVAVEAATTLETPGRALTSAEREALTT